MKTLRVALLGTGDIVSKHIEALRLAKQPLAIVAAVNPELDRAKEFCQTHVIPHAYDSTPAMLEAIQPDVVHICTPPGTHYELIIPCLEAGAWVVCEKPLCASLAQLQAIDDAEQRTGKYVSTIFQWRFGSGAQHLKKLISGGTLGKFLVGTCQTLWYRDMTYYQVPWRGKWATDIGGTSTIHGIHLTDLFLWLMAGQTEWQEVIAMMGTLDRPIESEDAAMALIRFDNGSIGSIANSALSPRQESHLRLDFQRVTAEVKSLYYASNEDWHYTLPANSPDQTELEQWQSIRGNNIGNHIAQVAAFLDSMERNERPPVSGIEARRIIEFLASLYKSAITRQPVMRGSIGTDDPFYYAMNGQPTS